jgi:antitoxin component of MazEF toxin-antitoxin module
MTRAIVTKTGNSYALRVPKRYIVDNHLQLGDTVLIDEPVEKQQQALRTFDQELDNATYVYVLA